MKNRSLYSFIGIAVIVVLAGLGIIFFSTNKIDEDKVADTSEDGSVAGVTTQDESGIDKEALAKYLSEKGAVMFGSAYCGHCKAQKEDFGDAFQYIDYVECGEPSDPNYNRTECDANEITGVPTWIYQGKKYSGHLELQKLADIVGYNKGY